MHTTISKPTEVNECRTRYIVRHCTVWQHNIYDVSNKYMFVRCEPTARAPAVAYLTTNAWRGGVQLRPI